MRNCALQCELKLLIMRASCKARIVFAADDLHPLQAAMVI